MSGSVSALTTARHRPLRPGQVLARDGATGTVVGIQGGGVMVRVPTSYLEVAEGALHKDEQKLLDDRGHGVFLFAKDEAVPLTAEEERKWAQIRIRAEDV
jgi:hypothetical protein